MNSPALSHYYNCKCLEPTRGGLGIDSINTDPKEHVRFFSSIAAQNGRDLFGLYYKSSAVRGAEAN